MKKFLLKKDELLNICKSSKELSSKAELLENMLKEDAIGGSAYNQQYVQSYTEHYGQSYARQIELGLGGRLF